jgi:hypothetical protein
MPLDLKLKSSDVFGTSIVLRLTENDLMVFRTMDRKGEVCI